MSQGPVSKQWMRDYQRERYHKLRKGEPVVPPINQELLNLDWKDIPGFTGYQASKCGMIMSCERHLIRSNGRPHTVLARIVKQRPDSKGYMTVGLYANKKRIYIAVARLIHMTWKGPIPMGMDVDHIDQDKLHNHVDNLQLLTPEENGSKSRRYWLQKNRVC